MGRLTAAQWEAVVPGSHAAANIRFTARYVRHVADVVETLTDGVFVLDDIGDDPGRVAFEGEGRYADMNNSALVWTGSDAPRCAAGYYTGAGQEWARRLRRAGISSVPWGVERTLDEVVHALLRNRTHREWLDRGREQAIESWGMRRA